MTPIRTLIVDDEPSARADLRSLLEREQELTVVGEFDQGGAALRAVPELRPDVLFLAAQLPDASGFEVASRLDPAELPVVVFTSAEERHAVLAFDAQALDFLVKPLAPGRLSATVSRARLAVARTVSQSRHRELVGSLRDLLENGSPAFAPGRHLDRFQLTDDGRTIWLDAEEVEWIAAAGNYSILHAGGGQHRLRLTIAELDRRLHSAQFVRIHRSTIVNRTRILEVLHTGHGEHTVLLHGGTRLRLGRSFRHRLLG